MPDSKEARGGATAHFGNGIHVDACLGRAHIDAGADPLGGCHSLWYGADQLPVTGGGALLNQCGKAANEIDTTLLGSGIQSLGDLHIGVTLTGTGHQSDGGNRNTLIDDGNTEFFLDLLAYPHQILGAAGNFVVNFLAAGLKIRVAAVQQADAHGDSADIQMPLIDHILRLQDVLLIQHGIPLRSDA